MTKVPTARALLGESPEKASDRVCRLRLVQGNLVGYRDRSCNGILLKKQTGGTAMDATNQPKYILIPP